MIDVDRQRRLIERLWNDRDTSVIDELYTEDFVGHDPQSPREGRAEFREWYDGVITGSPDFRIEIDEIIATGDMTAARWRASGTHTGEWAGIPATNRSWSVDGLSMSRYEGDKIAETWQIGDMLGFMQQIGLVPEMAT